MNTERFCLSKAVTMATKWRSYGQGAEGNDAVCEDAPKPQVWLAHVGVHGDYVTRGPAAASYHNDGK
jgi:hypothetical protein